MGASPVKRAFRTGASTVGQLGAVVVSVAAALAAPCFSRVARANNGIPGSLGVLLPLARPQEIGLATTAPPSAGGAPAQASVYASADGGATFGATPLYTAPAGASIVGIEIARSDPQVVYLTYVTLTNGSYHPTLVRSSNGGQSWT